MFQQHKIMQEDIISAEPTKSIPWRTIVQTLLKHSFVRRGGVSANTT